MSLDLERRWAVLRDKINSVGELLERQGSLASRWSNGCRAWSVRFIEVDSKGRKRQRCIYVGVQPLLVERARKLIAQHRARSNWNNEAAAAVKFGGALLAAARRSLQRRKEQP